MGHLLGYARVSTTDQQPHLQVDALTAAGCSRVFTETASGARSDIPTLEQLLDQLRPGDALAVREPDRLGRSLRHLVDTVTGLAERGIGVPQPAADDRHQMPSRKPPSRRRARHHSACLLPPDGHSVRSDQDEGGLQVPRYLLINETEPRWRLHDTVDSADLEKSLARVIQNGVITYTLASRNEGETFQSLTINGKTLVTYVITEEDDPDPAKTRSRYEAAGFWQP